MKPVYLAKFRHLLYLREVASRLTGGRNSTKRNLCADFFSANITRGTFAALPSFPSNDRDLVSLVNLRTQMRAEKRKREEAEMTMIMQQLDEIDAKRGAVRVGLDRGWLWM